MTRAPEHAGRLRVTERLAFVMMFTVMAGFVVGLSVVAAKTGARTLTDRTVADSPKTQAAQQGSVPLQAGTGKRAARTRSARHARFRFGPGDLACSSNSAGIIIRSHIP